MKRYARLKKVFINILGSFIPFSSKRRKIKKYLKNKYLSKTIFINNIDKECTKIPIEPWAFIRVRNEIKTLDSCLKSILPVIKKGVIGYNDCDDGSEEYILNFCKKNKGFIPFKYPYTVYPSYHEAYKDNNVRKENRLDTYSNKVLENIPKGEWIIKIDCDHVFNTEKLRRIMYLPKTNEDCIILSRIDLHIENEKIYIHEDGLIETTDFWIVKNNNLHFKFHKGYKNGKFFAYEHLSLGAKYYIHTELINYHFPYLKNYRSKLKKEEMIPLEEFLKNENIGKKIDLEMLDKERILSIYKKFNLKNY